MVSASSALAVTALQLRFHPYVVQQWRCNGDITCALQVMDVEMLVKMTLTKTVCQILMISALKTWRSVRLTSENSR